MSPPPHPISGLEKGLSKASVPIRHEDGRMDQKAYSLAPSPMQGSPRNSHIQEGSWPQPLAPLSPSLRRQLG